MKRRILGILAGLLNGILVAGLVAPVVVAQVPQFPQTLSPNTVLGRLGIGPGPVQPIPFVTLFGNLLLSMTGDVEANVSGVATIQPGVVTNSKLATVPADTAKCNPTGSAAAPQDCTAAQMQALIGPVFVPVVTYGVNFNSANTDTPIAITLPTGYTTFIVSNLYISGASGSITTATAGLFTAAAGGGTALVAGGTAITVSTAAANTNNNTMVFSISDSNTQSYNLTTLYFRVAAAEGSAATANVILHIRALY